MTTPQSSYSLTELAAESGVPGRTIRYYIAQGVLPAPIHGGPSTRYGQGHVDRLHLIRMLQRQHQPLAEIRARLEALSDDESHALIEQPVGQPDSAIDYIRKLMTPAQAHAPAPAMPPPAARFAAPAPVPAQPPSRLKSILRPRTHESPAPYGTSPSADAMALPLPGPARSQWERISLDPDIELHVRRPLRRHQNKAVERSVTLGRQLLEEEPS